MKTDFMASRNHYFHAFQPVAFFFLIQWKRIFEANPLFWLVETDFLLSGNHFVQIFN